MMRTMPIHSSKLDEPERGGVAGIVAAENVGVDTSSHGHLVGQDLDWHDRQERRDQLRGFGYREHRRLLYFVDAGADQPQPGADRFQHSRNLADAFGGGGAGNV